MLKEFIYEIPLEEFNTFFSPIREKTHIIILLMETIKLILIGNTRKIDKVCGKIILKIDKESRLYYQTTNKYYSVSFPFSVEEVDSKLNFKYYSLCIDSRITSDIIGLFSCSNKFATCSPEDFIDSIFDFGEQQYIYEIWGLTKYLLFFEDGYIRYDFDSENENGRLHPLIHYDIFYSNASTFKIGLYKENDIKDFQDFLNLRTNCHFIEKLK